MTEEKNVYTFKAGDIFEDIKDDPSNVLMNIPPEISVKTGYWSLKVRFYKCYLTKSLRLN